jgi:hypothetical protein
VLAFDRYTGQGWEIKRENQLQKITRPEWSYRFFLSLKFTAGRTKEIIQTYTAVSELPNLIPALSHPQQLYFSFARNSGRSENSLRAPASLGEGLTYTVISDVPYRDRSLLQKATNDYSKSIRRYYLDVPPRLRIKSGNVPKNS